MARSPFSYIDCHTHLARDLQETSYFMDAHPETLLSHMKDNNIRYALVYAAYINSKNDMDNEKVRNIAEQYAPYLVGVGAIDINNFQETFTSAKQYWKEGFFRAIKLYPTYQCYRLDHQLLDEFYLFCQENLIPVIIHIGKCRKTPFRIKPDEIENLISRYPKLIIVIPHFGMTYVKQTLELMERHKDSPIFVDTSCLWPGTDKDFLRKLLNYYKRLGLSSNRVLFGTDFPMSRADDMIKQINMSNLDYEEKRQVFYQNSMSLFRITRPYSKNMFSRSIKEVVIIPTNNCNNECLYCLRRSSKKNSSQLPLDDFSRILKKAKKENILRITFFGGEPTLWSGLADAIEMAKDAGMEVNLYTNGIGDFEETLSVDIVHLHLNTVDEKTRKKLECVSRGGFQLHGNITVSRYIEVDEIEKILQDIEDYTSITLMLDRTEKDMKENQNNFDKAVKFKDCNKVLVEVIVPFCQFRHDQKLLMKMENDIMEVKCFPGWDKIVVDSDMAIKNCFASDAKIKFDEKIPFWEAREILSEKVKEELNQLPLSHCSECVDFQSNACYGGCKYWKEDIYHTQRV